MVRGVEAVFRALADPHRRVLLDQLHARDGQTLSELEAHFPELTRFGVMKHLKVLESAELVTTRKVGRNKYHYLNPVPIRQLYERWITKFTGQAAAALIDLKRSLEGANAMPATPPAHVFTIYIRATPDEIWDALTKSEFTLDYYYGSTVESSWEKGAPYVFSIGGNPAIVGEVLESDRPNRLVTTFDARWDDDVTPDAPTRVTYEIEAAGPMSKLSVVHDGFTAENATYRQVRGGWPLISSGLKTLLETGSPLAS